MSRMQRIQVPVEKELAEFQGHFKSAMRTDVALLDRIMRYIIKRKGKQIRPLFVFLSAQTVAGGEKDLGERSRIAASLIELLHTATLVHDDVVDESPLRRGFFSIQALWKKKIAVLVGDYLLSRGLLMAVDREAYDLLKMTSEAVRLMSEGELLQIEKARRLDITEEVYFDIIQRKTASLIALKEGNGPKIQAHRLRNPYATGVPDQRNAADIERGRARSVAPPLDLHRRARADHDDDHRNR